MRISYVYFIILFVGFVFIIENVNGQTWKWIGNSNDNWNVADNWDRGSVPPNNSNVLIAYVASGVYPKLDTDVSVSNITISDWNG